MTAPSSPPHRSATAPHLLQVSALTCRRGGRRLFHDLSLDLAAGECLWLRGDNGRGKTSLLRLLAGLVEPDEGEVRWPGGRPLYVAHANALKDDLTVAESLRFLARLSSLAPEPDDASIDAALERVGLLRSRDAMARTLSQGQRRRAALARLAMPSVARVWLLDEPFDALDQASIGTLNGLLLEHLRGGGAIVLTSHQALGADAPACREFWLHERALSEAKS